MSNKEIAAAMDLSHNTVKNHMTLLMEKFDVHDRVQLALTVVASGLIELK